MTTVLPFEARPARRPSRASGAGELVDLDAARRARADERRLSDLQVALVRKARRLRRRPPVVRP